MKRSIFILFVLTMIVAGCKNKENEPEIVEPTAIFQYQIQQPLSVKFTDCSQGNPSQIKWDFGDGKTSEEKNPTHKYDAVGQYLVTLFVSNSSGESSVRKQITISAPKVCVSGVKLNKIGKENKYYRVECIDDDIITSWSFKTSYTPLVSNSSLPYLFNLNNKEMTELDGDNYYTVYVYWNTTTSGNGTQILKQKMYTSDIKKYPSEITLNSDNKDTQVSVLFSYR